jgi:hypothetical protein
LGDWENSNNISGQSYNRGALHAWVDSLMLQLQRETYLNMSFNKPADYRKLAEDDLFGEVLLWEFDRHGTSLPIAPRLHQVVLFCVVHCQVHHLKWWIIKYFADLGAVFHMFAEMGDKENTEMQST